ncbi:hypothetical protein GSS88_00125 [Corynebacterium sp. 3HC-13]|uniref:hypothetical protein n=1 Tax=Corynebacterium poyangense TaxID=2684405 RepID=UPI001CCC53F8|nr:hypothetical protein [Corynebacterium poyangense]MBZ8176216.1 hypothetical protein [Corynebacterium poyangense]
MSIYSRLVRITILTFVCLLIAQPLAYADPSDSGKEDKGTIEKCTDSQIADKAIFSLAHDGKVPDPGMQISGEEREAILREHGDLVHERVEELKNNPGIGDRVDSGVNRVMCTVVSPGLAAVDAVKDGISKFWDSSVGEFTEAVLEGHAETLKFAMTFWMDYDTSSLGGGDLAANVNGVKNIVFSIAGLALVASFIIGGIKLIYSRQQGLQDGLDDIGKGVGRWLVFSTCVPVIAPGAIIASDSLSKQIMTSFGANSPDQVVELAGLDKSMAGPVVMLTLAIVALLGAAMQFIALVTRVVIFPIVVGLSPLFAALSFSEKGKQGLQHLVSYGIAIVCFKPISALLYCVVFWNATGGKGDDSTLTGLVNATMVGLAGFSAPALVRAIVPAVAQAGGGGAGAAWGMASGALGAGFAAVGAISGGMGSMLSAAGSKVGGGSSGSSLSQAGAKQSASGGSSGSRGPTSAAGPASRSGHSGGSQPTGSQSSGGRGRQLAQGVRRGASAAMRGGSHVARGVAGMSRGLSRGSEQVGNHMRGFQGVFDDSIGAPGGYAGQVHR